MLVFQSENGETMKILITGANGQLGQDLQEVIGDRFEVFSYDLDLDVADNTAVLSAVAGIKPSIVLHAAAYTNVDDCETNVETAYRVNTIGAANVAIACNQANAKLVYVSTDYVFNGLADEPYLEYDEPDPRTVYGRSKLAGERVVSALCSRFFIIRTAWLYGRSGHNFVKTILKLAEERDELSVVNDQTGSPTSSYDLAEKINELMVTEKYGIYHATNSGLCTWYDFATLILAIAGKSTPIRPVSTAQFPRPAPRPKYSVLRNLALELNGFQPMRAYEEALEHFMSERLR